MVSHIYFMSLLPKNMWYTLPALRGYQFLASVQFSHSVVSNFLQPHGLQHTRLPCSLLSPGVCTKFISTESVMLSKPSHPLLPPSLPALNLSQYQGVFQ